jgi:hypothetical protein
MNLQVLAYILKCLMQIFCIGESLRVPSDRRLLASTPILRAKPAAPRLPKIA